MAAFFTYVEKGEILLVHQYKLNGYNMVLDTCSRSVHVVDEVAYDMIALYPDTKKEVIITQML